MPKLGGSICRVRRVFETHRPRSCGASRRLDTPYGTAPWTCHRRTRFAGRAAANVEAGDESPSADSVGDRQRTGKPYGNGGHDPHTDLQSGLLITFKELQPAAVGDAAPQLDLQLFVTELTTPSVWLRSRWPPLPSPPRPNSRTRNMPKRSRRNGRNSRRPRSDEQPVAWTPRPSETSIGSSRRTRRSSYGSSTGCSVVRLGGMEVEIPSRALSFGSCSNSDQWQRQLRVQHG